MDNPKLFTKQIQRWGNPLFVAWARKVGVAYNTAALFRYNYAADQSKSFAEIQVATTSMIGKAQALQVDNA